MGWGGRSPSDALIIGSGNFFLFPQQIVFISVIIWRSVSLPMVTRRLLFPSCSPYLLLQAIAPSISLIISGGGGGGGGGGGRGREGEMAKMQMLIIASAF